MAQGLNTTTIRLVPMDQPVVNPFTGPQDVEIPSESPTKKTLKDGILTTENDDGSLTVDLSPSAEDLRGMDGNLPPEKEGHLENLAEKLTEDELGKIASDLLESIRLDNDSRSEWMQTRADGIKLLGLKLNTPTGEASPDGPVSQVIHPLLLEATLRFQANARGELLPASGPLKVRNDAPVKPQSQPAPGSPPTGLMPPPSPVIADGKTSASDDLANALETDMNYWLTSVAKEYYPDTDRMLFWVGAGGQGIKKVYNCPIRMRPVSESVDAEDLIVSNAETNLENCPRITHRIKMSSANLKRMQILGEYLDVPIDTGGVPPPEANPVTQEKNEIQGYTPQPQFSRPTEHEIYECYCELDIPGYEHKTKKGKITGLQVPYVVTIHVQTRKVLQIRRNWKEGDKMCLPKQYFVDFAFVRALGFYGIGLIHILGNTTSALTAAWRVALDSGMFANFPGFLFQKPLSRQLTNMFRVPPGGGVPIDTGGMPLRDAVIPLPYKEAGAGFINLIGSIEAQGQKVGATAEMNVGEGKQEAPVGTTLALIEQATKIVDAVHKRLHSAQAQEFALLKDRFKEDPAAFWRHSGGKMRPWEKQQFLDALENNKLIPVADPNNPTSMHRVAKAMAIKELQKGAPELYDPIAVDTRVMRIVGIDPEGLFRKEPAPPPPNPSLIAAQAKADAQKNQQQFQLMEMLIKQKIEQQNSVDAALDRESREKIEAMRIQLERLRIIQEQIEQDSTRDVNQWSAQMQVLLDQFKHQSDHELKLKESAHAQQMKLVEGDRKHASDMEKHGQTLENQRIIAQMNNESNQTKAVLDNIGKVEVAKAKPKPKPAAKKKT